MAETIPEDVVFEILVWLPVASLLRFKSVCKSWLSLIDSSRFISQHTQQRSVDDDKLIALNMDPRDYFYFSINFISVNHLQLFKYIEFLPTDHTLPLFNTGLIASFNGLICICIVYQPDFQYTDVVSLWNPATTLFTILPPGQSDIKYTQSGPHVIIQYGFGFDAQTNDYKVVRVCAEYYDAYAMVSIRSQVEVYSLSMGCWRIIDAVLPVNFLIEHNPKQPLRNEIYCWSGFDNVSGCSSILSFDFSKEVFGIMPVPDVCSNPADFNLILGFLRGKIAIACITRNEYHDDYNHCKIWVLDKYGVKESWTSPYTIMLDEAEEPMGFSMDGNIILINDERKLRLCDPLTQEFKEVSTQGFISEAAVYKESLISFKNATGVTKRVVYQDLSGKDPGFLDSEAMLSQEDDLVL